MQGFLLRTAISSVGLWIASALISDMTFDSTQTLLLAAVLLGLVNAVVRPVIIILTLPITVLTLGLFLWFVNAAMLGLVAKMLDGFTVGGWWAALFASLIVGATGWIASWYINPAGRIEAIVVHRIP